jgi:hypothetical protein
VVDIHTSLYVLLKLPPDPTNVIGIHQRVSSDLPETKKRFWESRRKNYVVQQHRVGQKRLNEYERQEMSTGPTPELYMED